MFIMKVKHKNMEMKKWDECTTEKILTEPLDQNKNTVHERLSKDPITRLLLRATGITRSAILGPIFSSIFYSVLSL